MKKTSLITVALCLALQLQAGPLKQAEFTRVVNDVKTLPEQQQPKPAKIGDVIRGRTAVTTGAQSRAELRFQDKTLTRLGSNSVFNMEQGTRNVDLKQGVMLMQVPKQMGGAQVRTAAVTAAVTGTTVMIEYQPDGYVKMIVLEGEMDVYLNDRPSVFRTIKAGDMIIMKPDSNYIPDPVQVDLERLKRTSKLTNEKEFGVLGNQAQLNQADLQQAEQKMDGELIETALVIPGRGTEVVVDIDRVRDLVQGRITVGPGTRPGANAPDGRPQDPPTSKFGRPGTLGGLAVVDSDTEIVTDPTIKTRFNGTVATGQGKIYRPGVDGGLGSYVFNRRTNRTDSTDLSAVPNVDSEFRSLGDWGAFKFADLLLVDQPRVNTVGGPRNLLLASVSDITLSDYDSTLGEEGAFTSGFWDMDPSGLNGLALVAYNNIYWEPGFTLTGSDQTVLLYTQSAELPMIAAGLQMRDRDLSSGDIVIGSAFSPAVSLHEGVFSASAARDLKVNGDLAGAGQISSDESVQPLAQPSAAIEAAEVKLTAARHVDIGSGTTIKASKTLHLRAGATLTVSDSAQLRRLSQASVVDIVLAAETGDVNINGVSGGSVIINGSTVGIESASGNVNIGYATISADFLRARTLSPNGQLLIGNSTLTAAGGIRLYAEGANGGVRFVGNSTLAGPALIAGKTVQIDSGVTVNVTQPNGLNIHSDNHNYNGGSHGNFINGGNPLNFLSDGDQGSGPRKYNFGSRPTY